MPIALWGDPWSLPFRRKSFAKRRPGDDADFRADNERAIFLVPELGFRACQAVFSRAGEEVLVAVGEGREFKRLTEGPGSHSTQMAPSRDYFLDTHSTVSRPPLTELRKADGTPVETVCRADTRELDKIGWPRNFRATCSSSEEQVTSTPPSRRS
jgi:hypothetical protein